MVILQKIKKTKLTCNNCNTSRLITDDVIGEIACSNCGCVISEYTQDGGVERRNLSDNSDNSRTGPGLSLKMHDKGLFTIIEDKPTRYVVKLLVILLPMLIVPIASYDFLIINFKHFTVIFSSMIVGFMIGVIILLVSDKIPSLIKQSSSKISNNQTPHYNVD